MRELLRHAAMHRGDQGIKPGELFPVTIECRQRRPIQQEFAEKTKQTCWASRNNQADTRRMNTG